MNSLVKVFSNFKEFYSEINGATLTGAIDVIVVEQPNGDFLCSPFHVRFGKLGVLRSREKIVDIEINGEPVDIHMKLGDSGEAFFVEEVAETDVEELPDNLATSPIPTGYFPNKYSNDLHKENVDIDKNAIEEMQIALPLPRRNSIDFSKEIIQEDDSPSFENQISDFRIRRYTDNTLERRNLSEKVREYTTQKLRKEWAEHEEIFHFDVTEKEKDWSNSTQSDDKTGSLETSAKQAIISISKSGEIINDTKPSNDIEGSLEKCSNAKTTREIDNLAGREDSKGKKRRRRKSQLKKKNSQRKSSSSSSLGSNTPVDDSSTSLNYNAIELETISQTISQNSNSSNEDESKPKSLDKEISVPLAPAINSEECPKGDNCDSSPLTPNSRIQDLDIHFFSDTEVTTSGGNGSCGMSRGAGRPSTPVQSDSELEISLREKDADVERMSNSASWKWGELPTPEHNNSNDNSARGGVTHSQAQRNSMLSGMFNFMKKTNKMRKQNNEGGVYLADLDAEGMDSDMASLYFPSKQRTKEMSPKSGDDDRESGNGTSLPHSPSSMEGQKSIDSDYDDSKIPDAKYLDFVAMSLCGPGEKGGDITDKVFDRHLVKYSDVCANPSLFLSPNLIVRLNGKYYNWAAACPIVMTIITFQKPLTDLAIEQLMSQTKASATPSPIPTADGSIVSNGVPEQTKRSWWYWRRSQGGQTNGNIVGQKKLNETGIIIETDQNAVATQTSRPNTPDVSDNTLSKTDSTLNAENTSVMVENLEDLSQTSSKSDSIAKNERFKKSLRLSSDAIKKLNLNDGMNEMEFSVTTAYQGTTRCKCYLFRWKYNDKVVISDIDGTITRSDVLGHILPMVGKDWAQLGVAQLFSKIEQNGYKLLYLSARAIGQSRATREYLRSIRQGDVKLPDGPLLLNPTSLISAFHREVIERKPEQFKIACLTDIRDLFPEREPFYAGYGNRINDVWAYRAVGIPIMRIFTINTKGELKHELTQTFQSSYCSMTNIVDQLFPPTHEGDEATAEFSSFNFWRDPIPEVSFELEVDSSESGMTQNFCIQSNNSDDASINSKTTASRNNCSLSESKVLKSIPKNTEYKKKDYF